MTELYLYVVVRSPEERDSNGDISEGSAGKIRTGKSAEQMLDTRCSDHPQVIPGWV
jgi:hypothetical protein